MDIDVFYESGYQRKRVRGMPAFPCFKGPEKVKPTAAEIQQEKNAVEMNRHFNSLYKPLEKQAIEQAKELTKEERRGLNAGRGSADIAQQAEQNKAQARETARASGADMNSDAATAGLRRTEDAITEGRNDVQTDSFNKAQSAEDNERLSLIEAGRDKSTRTDAGLRQQADTEASSARAKLEREQMLDSTRQQAFGNLATTAALSYWGGGTKPNVDAPAPPAMLNKNTIRPSPLRPYSGSTPAPINTDVNSWMYR